MLWSRLTAGSLTGHSRPVGTIKYSRSRVRSRLGTRMLTRLGGLFSSITSSSGSKDFPYTSSSSTQLTSLWKYCKASKKVL